MESFNRKGVHALVHPLRPRLDVGNNYSDFLIVCDTSRLAGTQLVRQAARDSLPISSIIPTQRPTPKPTLYLP